MDKEKNPDKKDTCKNALTSQAFGGVSEPAIFGVCFPNKKVLFGTCLSCGLGSLYLGLTQTCVNVMSGGFGFMGFLIFWGGEVSNGINGTLACLIALVAGFITSYMFYNSEN